MSTNEYESGSGEAFYSGDHVHVHVQRVQIRVAALSSGGVTARIRTIILHLPLGALDNRGINHEPNYSRLGLQSGAAVVALFVLIVSVEEVDLVLQLVGVPEFLPSGCRSVFGGSGGF